MVTPHEPRPHGPRFSPVRDAAAMVGFVYSRSRGKPVNGKRLDAHGDDRKRLNIHRAKLRTAATQLLSYACMRAPVGDCRHGPAASSSLAVSTPPRDNGDGGILQLLSGCPTP
jgi:hypothetical protein